MKIFIICSKHFYSKIPQIKQELEKRRHIVTLPNSFEAPFKEEEMKVLGKKQHKEWKRSMLALHEPKVKENDAVLVLNYNKEEQENYIGGATFLEIYKAYEYGKKIFLYNPIPENIFKDELTAIDPIILLWDISLIQ